MNKKNIALIIFIITTFNSIQSSQATSKEDFDTRLYKQANKRPVDLSASPASTIGLYSKDKELPRIITPFLPTSKKDSSLCTIYVSDDNDMYSQIEPSGNISHGKQNKIVLEFFKQSSSSYKLYSSDVAFGIQHTYEDNIIESPIKLTRKQIEKIKEIKEYNIILWDGKHRYDILYIEKIQSSLLDQINETNKIIAQIPQLHHTIAQLIDEKADLEAEKAEITKNNKLLFTHNIALQEEALLKNQNTSPSQEPIAPTMTNEPMYKTKLIYFMGGSLTMAIFAALAFRFLRA